jgi:carboxypeptidase C (cathepsin A)
VPPIPEPTSDLPQNPEEPPSDSPEPPSDLPPAEPIVPIIGRRTDGDQNYYLKPNPYSWSESAHMLFIEQPIRTGYSKAARGAREVTNEDDVAQDFYHFMQSFLTVFPEYQGLPVYITGESYAGMYIPWIAEKIVKRQISLGYERQFYPGAPDDIHVDLQGIAIGM